MVSKWMMKIRAEERIRAEKGICWESEFDQDITRTKDLGEKTRESISKIGEFGIGVSVND